MRGEVDSEFEDYDFVMPADPARCVELTLEAAGLEQQAMELDRRGAPYVDAAVKAYRRTADKLREAERECPEDHDDKLALKTHADEVASRADYLERLAGAPAAIPVEDHIRVVTLSLGQEQENLRTVRQDCLNSRSAGAVDGQKIMGAAAAIGGTAGLLFMGPLSAVALGVGAAYASTREDKAGLAVRQVGKAGVKAVSLTKKINEEYGLGAHALAVGQSAIDQVVLAGTKVGLTDRAKALHTWNERHKVTHTLGWGISTAGSAITGLVFKSASR